MAVARWYLPKIDAFADCAHLSQNLRQITELIQDRRLHPRCPLLGVGAGVKAAADFVELRPIFERTRTDFARLDKESYPVPLEEVQRLEDLFERQRANKSSDEITPAPRSVPRVSSVSILRGIDVDDPLNVLKKPVAKATSKSKEWWLPDVPEFEGRHAFPQNLDSMRMLIEKGALRPEHWVRHLYGAPAPAGKFKPLIPIFSEKDPGFEPFLVRPAVPLAAPGSGWDEETLRSKVFKTGEEEQRRRIPMLVWAILAAVLLVGGFAAVALLTV